MKVKSIVVEFEPDADDDGNLGAIRGEYDGETKRWTIHGPIYARKLKALAEISKIAMEGDKA